MRGVEIGITCLIMTIMCYIQEKNRQKLTKKYSYVLANESVFVKYRWIIYTLFLLFALDVRQSLYITFFGLLVINLLPLQKKNYRQQSIQIAKTIMFMSTMLIYKGITILIFQNMDPLSDRLVHAIGLCISQAVVLIYILGTQKPYLSRQGENPSDTNQVKKYYQFLVCCCIYVFSDGLLSLLGGEMFFVALTLIAGNILIMILILSFLYNTVQITNKESLKNEYINIEKEKALQQYQRDKFFNMARYDVLTHAYSRRYAIEQIETYHQEDIDYYIAYIDMDDMKEINDLKGHHEGDLYLENFAQAMMNQLDNQSFLARLGGDEFIIVFKNKKEKEVQLFMEEVTQNLNDFSFSYGLGRKGKDLQEALSVADRIMYKSKKEKRED